jgi:atypical dual specificity phosphatase
MALLARVLFYPTLWWNVALSRLLKRRRWWDWIDDWVLLGAFPSARHIEKLKLAGVGAVVNTCREHCGPQEEYRRAGIEQLHLPIIDFVSPSLDDVRAAVAFIHAQIARGRKVYVHCKAGRGRSATVALCYLISKGLTPEQAQLLLIQKRPHVLGKLCKRPVVAQFVAEWTARRS